MNDCDLLYYDDEQGSDAWLEARRGVITASRFKDCRDYKKDSSPSEKLLGYAMDVARERVGGLAPGAWQSPAMREGQIEEPRARAATVLEKGYDVRQVGFFCTEDRRFGVSVDGLVDDDGVIEIKTMVSSKTFFQAVIYGDISEYIDQCNGAMWLLGRKWVDLVLWCPDMEAQGLGLTIRRIERDDDAINALEADLIKFDRLVDKLVQTVHDKAREAGFDPGLDDVEPPTLAADAPIAQSVATTQPPPPKVTLTPDAVTDDLPF